MSRRDEVEAHSWELFLKSLLDNLFQSQGQRTAEQSAQNWSIPCRMDCLGVNPHLNPKPDSLEFHPIAVGRPLDPPKHRPEPSGDLMDRCFEAASGLFLGPAVLDGQADQRHIYCARIPRTTGRVNHLHHSA